MATARVIASCRTPGAGIVEFTVASRSALRDHAGMADRVMFVQLKTGHGVDLGPAWISLVRFNKSWKTVYWHGKTLHRWTGMFDANFYDSRRTRSTGFQVRTATVGTRDTATSNPRSTTTPARLTRRS